MLESIIQHEGIEFNLIAFEAVEKLLPILHHPKIQIASENRHSLSPRLLHCVAHGAGGPALFGCTVQPFVSAAIPGASHRYPPQPEIVSRPSKKSGRPH